MIRKPFLSLILFILITFCDAVYAQHSESNGMSLESTKRLVKPPDLKAGDLVAIVAPSGILKNREKEIEQAKNLLESWGLSVVVGNHVFSQDNHFAGTDAQRAEDFQKAMDNPNIKAIWCARGGYGTVRILDKLDYTKFRENPKWLIGYSDITALHNDIHNLGVETIHGLMCSSLTEDLSEIEKSVSTFKDAIFGNSIDYSIGGSPYNKEGTTKGQLVGGNLTLLHTMLGSRTSIDTEGKILFFEEIGEYRYHIDRMLQSLKRAGYFKGLKGVIVGDISNIRKNTTPWGKSTEQLILDVFKEYDIPIMFGFPAGHEDDNLALILGRTLELVVTKEGAKVSFEN